MLNKEFLLATGSQTEGHIKLTVGSGGGFFGYYKSYGFGSVNRLPTWNLNGKPVTLEGLLSDESTALFFYRLAILDAREITITVVEKGLTVTLKSDGYTYTADAIVFNSSDVGKTFTIVFVPEPTGYA